MTDVVAIHGMSMNWRSRAEMLRVWHDAMVRGLQNVRYSRADDLVLECAFYGHLYNDGKAATGVPYKLSDLEPGLEQELFLAIGDAAGGEKDLEDDGLGTKAWRADPFQSAVRRIERHGIFDGVSATAINLVKQVGRYFRDQDFARQVHDELAMAMETKPRVLIAHSLGSVIAYDWLRRQPQTPVATLITIGSPLGFRGIRRALHAQPNQSLPLWPGVPAWVNVAAIEDSIAMVKQLDGLFDGPVADRLARNPRRTAHSAAAYLKNVHTSNALKVALD